MAKDSIRDYSASSSNNSDIQSVDISEGCAPSGLNNAIREVMTDLKNVSTGTVALETPVADSFSTDTISEKTSGSGVTIDGVLLKDGAIGSIASAVAAHLTSINGGQIGGSRNLIINGNMAVSQRGTQATGITTTGFRTVDRFRTSLASLGTWTEDQSTDAPDGFSNSFKLTCTTADASPAAGDIAYIRYMFEGNELQMLSYGTSSAKAMTLSFWVKSNKTGSATVQLLQNDNSAKNISPSYTISSANTWEYKTVSIPADTAGNIDNDNGPAVALIWYLNSGSNFSSGTTRTTWTAYSATDSNPANLGVGGATSDYFQITGVQLEVGSATPFEHESFAETLQKCQRYFQRYVAGASYTAFGIAQMGSSTNFKCAVEMVTTMRASGTFSASNTGINHGPQRAVTSFATSYIGKERAWIDGTCDATGLSAQQSAVWNANNNSAAYIQFSAEL